MYRRYAKDHELYVLKWGESRKARTMGGFLTYTTLAVAKK